MANKVWYIQELANHILSYADYSSLFSIYMISEQLHMVSRKEIFKRLPELFVIDNKCLSKIISPKVAKYIAYFAAKHRHISSINYIIKHNRLFPWQAVDLTHMAYLTLCGDDILTYSLFNRLVDVNEIIRKGIVGNNLSVIHRCKSKIHKKQIELAIKLRRIDMLEYICEYSSVDVISACVKSAEIEILEELRLRKVISFTTDHLNDMINSKNEFMTQYLLSINIEHNASTFKVCINNNRLDLLMHFSELNMYLFSHLLNELIAFAHRANKQVIEDWLLMYMGLN